MPGKLFTHWDMSLAHGEGISLSSLLSSLYLTSDIFLLLFTLFFEAWFLIEAGLAGLAGRDPRPTSIHFSSAGAAGACGHTQLYVGVEYQNSGPQNFAANTELFLSHYGNLCCSPGWGRT